MLTARDFPAFFTALHGRPPFRWQTRLCEAVFSDGWCSTIAAPTGTGKTAVIDIALFHLAAEAASPKRTAPLRIVFAVDRRVVVDQAFERAKHIGHRLAAPDAPVLASVAEALRTLAETPLHVEQLRGGMPREDDWALTPTQPTVLCTTVDQLGSRLLFRGYGVSPAMAPIHAGLLGEDALILLDEAHLSHAFHDTLEGIAHHRTCRDDPSVGRPWAVVALTATPAAAARTFHLTPEERAEPAIARRLAAHKPARLVLLSAETETDIASAYAKAAADWIADCGRSDPVIAVVVNRVRLARLIHAQLRADHGDDAAILLTGRVRPVERDDLIERYKARLSADGRLGGTAPLFVVATQCIEAGADFDVDALITQIAPLDALRQRFGRLNRLGMSAASPAAILAAKAEVAARAQDPVYGDRMRATWAWLKQIATRGRRKGDPEIVDFGVDALDALLAAAPADTAASLAAPAARAPRLRRPDIAFFAVTNPSPAPDVALPLYLRGRIDAVADVGIIWRADLTETDLDDRDRAIAIVTAMPPRPGEAVSVPVWAARAWLGRHAGADELPDLDMTVDGSAGNGAGRAFVRWRRGALDPTDIDTAANLRPGDLIVLPAEAGGCDPFGWAPLSTEPVRDIADRAAAPYRGQRRRAVLRLHPAIWPGEDWRALGALLAEADLGDARGLVAAARAIVAPEGALAVQLADFAAAPRLTVETPYDSAETRPGLLLVAPAGVPGSPGAGDGSTDGSTDDDDAGSFSRQAPQTLAEHTRAVAKQAAEFAARLRLPDRLARSLALAASLHDDGKADPRFQAYLSGGATSGEPLAKSGTTHPGRAADRAARRASGLPGAWRHEVLSVRLAVPHLHGRDDVDPDLVLFLIGVHHGQGRPFFRHDDPWEANPYLDLPPGSGPDRLDFAWNGRDWTEVFDGLRRRYGTWGLAWLEAILRLADHRASEAGT